jgi:flagellar hook assembly protein FlgD
MGYVTKKNDGTATLSYPMSELSEGHHTLTFSIADNVGNRTTATISFIISTASEEGAKLTIKESPARTVATITLEESSIESNYNRLIIKDNKGHVVISKENVSLPYEWDLKDSDGKAVADGRYKAYLLYRNSSIYGNTPETDILVIK